MKISPTRIRCVARILLRLRLRAGRRDRPPIRIRCAARILLPPALCLLVAAGPAEASLPVPYPIEFTPSTHGELLYLHKIAGAVAADGTRRAEKGKFWIYALPVAPGSDCALTLTLAPEPGDALPAVQVLDAAARPIAARITAGEADTLLVRWTAPMNAAPGAVTDVMLSARAGAFSVRAVRFQQVPAAWGSIPLSVHRLMSAGLPATALPTLYPPPATPVTVSRTLAPASPETDVQTDAILVHGNDAALISGMQDRGAAVWCLGPTRADKEYAAAHKEGVQTDSGGNLLSSGPSYYLTPTKERIDQERAYFDAAAANGATGVCLEEPEYLASAGYEFAFKSAWQDLLHGPWQDPTSGLNARYRASSLMQQMEAAHLEGVLSRAQTNQPTVRRMVALHSPLSNAYWGFLNGLTQVQPAGLDTVQEVIGQVWADTAVIPARYGGMRRERLFDTAFLEYSSLYQLTRGRQRLWFLVDPASLPTGRFADYRTRASDTLIAALLFPDVTAYEAAPWPEKLIPALPAGYASCVNTILAALQDMRLQPVRNGAQEATVGVLLSSTMAWQRTPNGLDALYGLTLPLLNRGIPVQLPCLERAAEPGYLNRFRTLLLCYDFQKPLDSRVNAALADWTRAGGSLLLVGGSDPSNGLSDAWWRTAGFADASADLWQRLGAKNIGAMQTVAPPAEDADAYRPADLSQRGGASTADLSPFVKAGGSLLVRFTPAPGAEEISVARAELRVNGVLAVSFGVGSEIENRFLTYDQSRFSEGTRRAGRGGSWTYRFDNLPRNGRVTLAFVGQGAALLSASTAAPEFGHTLLAAPDAANLGLPRLRIVGGYPASIYPGAAEPSRLDPRAETLYTLREGGTPLWTMPVGRGQVTQVGVAPGFFSSSDRAAGLLRALTVTASQRAGAAMRGASALRLRRGKYTVIHTLTTPEVVEGRTLDLLSPTLAVAMDRTIAPHTSALLADMPGGPMPRIGYISGRLQASVETPETTLFYARGPRGTVGLARLHAGTRRLAGARATNWLGRPVAVSETVEGSTLLLKYPNDPDGVVVRVGWK